MDDLTFDFEAQLQQGYQDGGYGAGAGPSGAAQIPTDDGQPKPRNYRRTVCTYWLRGLCMKGDTCGFLHQFDPERMPVCRALLKHGVCKEPDCPYKHSMDAIKECNMYKLGFCIYGPACRFKHTRQTGPPPDPETLEACKPREHRNLNIVANQANENILPEREARGPRRPRGGQLGDPLALPPASGANAGALLPYTGPGGGGGGSGRQPGGQPGGMYPGAPAFIDPALLAAVGQSDLRFGF
ncbi:Cleavage and polyadenylation specificity factor CPSF30 [Micractinium conductrix]|uniref:Cleavage and polyadenylation specificity factor CPSF30 n=1 Tax=Micractinium conductrix TaxID=554055 RepID=A0A2P6V7Y0_9CHLO|nr:Cleavage and polyadenylation specificity factor CPSF30 [Micractinium conductrix]|eukprot:PSC70196.1 Cleavage and polyadenylation specificity factor CPSF30 [Micractinium conductrix]